MSAGGHPDAPLHHHVPALLLVAVGALTSTVRWLEMLAVAVFVFDRTGSPFLVALMSLLRMLPLALCGPLAGVLAERLPRRTLLLVGLAGMTAMSLLLAALAAAGRLAVWHVALAAFLGGLLWAMDFPVRRTLIGDLLPPRRLVGAMSLDVVGNNGSRMAGPLLGGVVLQAMGMTGAFAIAAALYAASAAAMLAVRHDEGPRPRSRGVLASLVEGLRHVAAHRDLSGLLVVTVIFNVFGFPLLSLVPVVARESLALNASATGGLVALEGAGVLLGAVALMLWSREQHYRRCYVGGLTLFLVAAMAFAASAGVVLAGLALLAAGLGGAGFSTMQSTLVMRCAAPAARPRVMGALSLCVGTAPLGLLQLGWLADLLGARTAIAATAAAGLLALGAALRAWPGVLAAREDPGG